MIYFIERGEKKGKKEKKERKKERRKKKEERKRGKKRKREDKRKERGKELFSQVALNFQKASRKNSGLKTGSFFSLFFKLCDDDWSLSCDLRRSHFSSKSFFSLNTNSLTD